MLRRREGATGNALLRPWTRAGAAIILRPPQSELDSAIGRARKVTMGGGKRTPTALIRRLISLDERLRLLVMASLVEANQLTAASFCKPGWMPPLDPIEHTAAQPLKQRYILRQHDHAQRQHPDTEDRQDG